MHEGRLPCRPFSLSAGPFPCFYRVGCLRVQWKQKPWFLSACKSAASNKIFTYLFFFNQTSRLKPPRAKIEGEAIGRECLKSENNYGETAKKYGINCRQARAAHYIDNGSMEKFRMAFPAPFSERSHPQSYNVTALQLHNFITS